MTGAPEAEDGLGDEERAVARRLVDQRPVPAGAFRGTLARRLSAADSGYRPRPEHLRLLVGSWCGAGSALVLLGMLIAH